MAVTRSHNLSVGLVGLPNSGKSTLFNAITGNEVLAANYPFATIDKNVGVVAIPDPRLDAMSAMFNSQKVVPSAMTFIDIAGLVEGASKGEGLGNQFLANIREVDVILFVLRAFESDKIVHVYDRVDPQADLDTLMSELALKDIESLQKRFDELPKKYRGKTEDLEYADGFLRRAIEWLSEGKPIRDMPKEDEQQALLDDLFLLTDKKMLFLLNVRAGVQDAAADKIEKFVQKQGEGNVVKVDVKMLEEMKDLSADEKEEMISMVSESERPAVGDDLLKKVYQVLDLITFYTGSEKEANAWAIVKGATVHESAGVIHTDLMETFVMADVVNINDLLREGGLHHAREAGLVRACGRDYIVQDGDYIIVNTH